MATATAELTKHNVVSHDKWTAARMELLAKEKEFTQLRDELSRERRELPWERVESQYEFEGPNGKVPFAKLFGKRSQLVVYHFMLGPGWSEGCKSCSYLTDHFDAITDHLANRDVNLVLISHAPYAEFQAFKQRMGWKIQWYSSFGTAFNFDYHVSFTPGEMAAGKGQYNYREIKPPVEELPGLSVFFKDAEGEIFHTYSTYERGLDILVGTYNVLDHVPKGRDEAGLSDTMAWVRHHDKYTDRYEAAPAGVGQTEQPVSASPSCCSGSH